ncbi:hypothetical protein CAPTEDRAFT_155942 [Capitella teleta]|uniref:Signal recognition particle subunit SRP68 n=1 Tax=Capitella teleta TaxID=283909 RepID=R7V0A0_CAPTE|nr:hypothetical protein CAPTEDRAFT_155942 [Capitella teleta]|eukprot:ELU12258.1 hypothetical protein CAPTEDRAFT_155942 [Capitella teleta]
MQLKSEANTEHRKRFHMINRMKKAVQHADHLAVLCGSEKCDPRTKLEACAYADAMKAGLHFVQEKWKTAMELYYSASTIYTKLAGAFVDEIKEIYLQRVADLAPNIRYCEYNIGDESAIKDLRAMRLKGGLQDEWISSLDELIEKTQERQAATLSEVTWRGRTIPVKNEKVRVFLMGLKEFDTQLEQAEDVELKLSVYETLLKELIDAQQSVKEENKEDPVSLLFLLSVDGGRVPNTVFLHSYLAYLRQTNTVQRNLLLISSLLRAAVAKGENRKVTKPQDLARLYDIIIQNLTEILSLPGLQDDPVLIRDIQAETLCYKAFRCFYIGRTCEGAKRWKEALALYEQVLVYAKESQKAYENVNTPGKEKEIRALKDLVKEVDGLKYSCHASSILDMEDLSDQFTHVSVKSNKPLEERLHLYQEDSSLATKKPNFTHFPPDFQPIACKPLFFDVALSLADYPSLEDKLDQKKQGGGISSFVKGWLWGGGKK